MMPVNSPREWLDHYLHLHGPCPSRQVKAAADDAGIPERTLKRAAAALRVHYASTGYPRVTEWSLPQLGHRHSAVYAPPLDIGPTGPTEPEQRKRGGHRKLDYAILHRIVVARMAGRSQRSIADDLNREGIPTAQRGVWRQQTIRKLLASPAAAAIRDELQPMLT